MKPLITIALVLCTTWTASTAVQTKLIEYTEGDTVLEGYLAYDDSVQGRRPAVLIVHQWKGLTDYEKKRAQMLAELGYNVLAADIYGKGTRPKDSSAAGAEAGKYKRDRELLRARARAGLEILRKHEHTDPDRIAAIGYCFGGTAVIELARSGAELSGVVSFHGGLDSPKPEDGKRIKCKVLALHGADDPAVAPKDLAAFEDEMRNAGVDWQLIKYGGAVHSFTDWNARGENKTSKYNERADKRSWEDMKAFFAELLGKHP